MKSPLQNTLFEYLDVEFKQLFKLMVNFLSGQSCATQARKDADIYYQFREIMEHAVVQDIKKHGLLGGPGKVVDINVKALMSKGPWGDEDIILLEQWILEMIEPHTQRLFLIPLDHPTDRFFVPYIRNLIHPDTTLHITNCIIYGFAKMQQRNDPL